MLVRDVNINSVREKIHSVIQSRSFFTGLFVCLRKTKFGKPGVTNTGQVKVKRSRGRRDRGTKAEGEWSFFR